MNTDIAWPKYFFNVPFVLTSASLFGVAWYSVASYQITQDFIFFCFTKDWGVCDSPMINNIMKDHFGGLVFSLLATYVFSATYFQEMEYLKNRKIRLFYYRINSTLMKCLKAPFLILKVLIKPTLWVVGIGLLILICVAGFSALSAIGVPALLTIIIILLIMK